MHADWMDLPQAWIHLSWASRAIEAAFIYIAKKSKVAGPAPALKAAAQKASHRSELLPISSVNDMDQDETELQLRLEENLWQIRTL